ncbi:MAG: pyocin activator PrtN family protein [Burkholderiaceae bacterium]|nr:pyocin activator PrtN family protein [Burkholderiaceae bacterium]
MKTEFALLLTYDRPVMTLEQVAELMGLSPRTLENNIYAQKCPIPMFKLGNKWHGHITDVAGYIDEQRAVAVKLLQSDSQGT